MTSTMTRPASHDSQFHTLDERSAERHYSLEAMQILPDRVSPGYRPTHPPICLLVSKRGTSWYSFASSNGNALRGGVQIPDSGKGLPALVTVSNERIKCAPVHKWDKTAGRYLDGYEDFDVKRIAEGRVVIDGTPMTARVLLSIRRDGRMNVTARIWPEDPITATACLSASPEGRNKPRVVPDRDLPQVAASNLTEAQTRLRERLDSTETGVRCGPSRGLDHQSQKRWIRSRL